MGLGSDGGSAGRGRWRPLRGEVVRVEVIPWGEVMGADPRRVAVMEAETPGGRNCGGVENPGGAAVMGAETPGGAAVAEWSPPGATSSLQTLWWGWGVAVTEASPPAPERGAARGTTAAARPA